MTTPALTAESDLPSTSEGRLLLANIGDDDYGNLRLRILAIEAEAVARHVRETGCDGLTVERLAKALAYAGVHVDLRPSDTRLLEPCESCAAGVERIAAALASPATEEYPDDPAA